MGITSVYLPDTIKTIGAEAFKNNNIETLHIPSSVEKLDTWVFANNKIKSLSIDEGIKTIGPRTIQYNELTEAVIPSSVTSIGACAYCNNPIPNASFLYARNGDSYDYSKIIGYIGDLSEFPDKVFRIPEEVNGVKLKIINSSAFERMSLTNWEVVIPETVTSIWSSTFYASGISKVNLPAGLNLIGNSAFFNNNLTELNIPSTVTKIDNKAFNDNQIINEEQAWIYKRTASGHRL